MELKNAMIFNRAKGCVFASMIADAMGSYMEFITGQQAVEKAKNAIKMPGGGTFKLPPGQITDDTQLAVSMSKGILKFTNLLQYQQQKIAKQYFKWFKSNPFDIGITTKTAFNINPSIKVKYSEQMVSNSQEFNWKSQSNGSLMRISPLIVLSLFHSKQQVIEEIVEADISLTHSSKVIKQAGKVWVLIIRDIIKYGDPKMAYQKFLKIQDKYQNLAEWYKIANQKNLMPANKSMGWARIAWTYGFHYLKQIATDQLQINNDTYAKVMLEVLEQGGDTDTNGCIVGMMVGAIIGIERIPQKYIQKVLNYKASYNRDEFHGKHLNNYLEQIFKKNKIWQQV